jgi:hypothetical protein
MRTGNGERSARNGISREKSDILLTLDRGDFETLFGGSFYGLLILKPGDFLERERQQGELLDRFSRG